MAGRRIDNVFLLLLYPREDETHKKALAMLEKGLLSSKWEYYYCEHDKDCDEDGVVKKAHTHVVLFTKRKMATSTLADQLLIGTNYTSYTNDVEDDLLYLTHDCPKGEGKYQYDPNEVRTNSKVDYITRAHKEASRNLTEDDKLLIAKQIVDALELDRLRETWGERLEYADVLDVAIDRGVGNYVMRNHQAIDKLIDRANKRISKKRNALKGFEPVCDDQEEQIPFGERK